MKICKSSELLNQKSFSKPVDTAWSIQEQQALTAFFSLLYEIHQQNNVTKEYVDAKQTERDSDSTNKTY